MIDTHCHLTYPQLADRLAEVLAGAKADGVDRMITIGTTPEDAMRARALADSHPHIFFAAGIHPHYAADVPDSELPYLAQLVAHRRCVAFGEMGLDYHYPDPTPKMQHQCFSHQLQTAAYSEIPKPIIIHCRKAVDDTLAIIRSSTIDGRRFVFHCCTEPASEVRKILDLGAMVSFTGIATYKNAPEVRESCLLVPDDRLMIETDAPYLSPEPHRKVRVNEPRFLAATAAFLAELRGMRTVDFIRMVDANAERFFGLPSGRDLSLPLAR